MAITYTIDVERQIIRETWTGRVTADDLADYWRAYLADPQVLELRRTLVDLGDAELAFTGAELDTLIQSVIEPVLAGRTWSTALIARRTVQFGVGHQYHVFASRYSNDQIFEREEDALAWLLDQPGP